MSTSASARSAYTPPDAIPLTTCCRRSLNSVAQVALADRLVAAELVGRSLDRDAACLEHVRAFRVLQGDVRVLLDDERRHPVLVDPRAQDVEDLRHDPRGETERRLVDEDQPWAR